MWASFDGLAVSLPGGTEVGLDSGGETTPLLAVCISPLAALNLLVKDEIAQPAQVLSFEGVLIRGAPAAAVSGGGRRVSGSVWLYFLTRCRYSSKVLLPCSRTILYVSAPNRMLALVVLTFPCRQAPGI